jgi:hypothetical protein
MYCFKTSTVIPGGLVCRASCVVGCGMRRTGRWEAARASETAAYSCSHLPVATAIDLAGRTRVRPAIGAAPRRAPRLGLPTTTRVASSAERDSAAVEAPPAEQPTAEAELGHNGTVAAVAADSQPAKESGDKAKWDPEAWQADAGALPALELQPLEGSALMWARLKMAFALPWRRFKKGSVLTFKVGGRGRGGPEGGVGGAAGRGLSLAVVPEGSRVTRGEEARRARCIAHSHNEGVGAQRGQWLACQRRSARWRRAAIARARGPSGPAASGGLDALSRPRPRPPPRAQLEGEISDALKGRFAPGFSVPQICSALEKAALDPRVAGVAVEISPLAVRGRGREGGPVLGSLACERGAARVPPPSTRAGSRRALAGPRPARAATRAVALQPSPLTSAAPLPPPARSVGPSCRRSGGTWSCSAPAGSSRWRT